MAADVRDSFTYSGAPGDIPFSSSPSSGDIILVIPVLDDVFILDPSMGVNTAGYETNPLAGTAAASKISDGSETEVNVTSAEGGDIHVLIVFVQDGQVDGDFDRSNHFGVPSGTIPDFTSVGGATLDFVTVDSSPDPDYDQTRLYFQTLAIGKDSSWQPETWDAGYWHVSHEFNTSSAGVEQYKLVIAFGPKEVGFRASGTTILTINYLTAVTVSPLSASNFWMWDQPDITEDGPITVDLRLVKVRESDPPYQVPGALDARRR